MKIEEAVSSHRDCGGGGDGGSVKVMEGGRQKQH